MFKNQLISSFRYLYRNTSYTLLNLLGLSIGIAAAILVYIWILDELSFDRFNTRYRDIYRIVQTQNYGDKAFRVVPTPAPMGFTFRDKFPEIIESARFRPVIGEVLLKSDMVSSFSEGIAFADSTFLKIFTAEFIRGSAGALFDPANCIITKSMADKYFQSDDPIGKSIVVNNTMTYRVAAVIEDIPANSHYTFSLLINIDVIFNAGNSGNWFNNSYYTYVLLDKNADYKSMESKFREIALGIWGEGLTTDFYLQPLKEVRLKSNFDIDLYSHSEPRMHYIFFFIIIGIFIILICTINYMNLATARYIRRAREVALRKVCGSSRKDIALQFFFESFLITIASYLVGLLIVEIVLPYFNDFSGKELHVSYSNPPLAIGLISVLVVTALLSGSYPALILSSFRPISILQGKINLRSELFRKILVVIQFSLSSILIFGTFIVFKQLNYINSFDLGLNRENIVYFPLRGEMRKPSGILGLKEEAARCSSIEYVTWSTAIPTYTVHSSGGLSWQGKDNDESYILHNESIDHDFISTMGIKIINGRNFDISNGADSGRVLINEAAVKMMNMDDPVGKWIYHWGDTMEIVGVMKDFNFKSLHKQVEPIRYNLSPSPNGYMIVKLEKNNIKKGLDDLQLIWDRMNPMYPFEFTFLDDEYNAMYELEQKTGTLFILFGAIAIFLACIGLFGLTSYFTEQKSREIAIRKANGASHAQVFRYLVSHFTRLVIYADILSIPLAYIILNNWISKFAYHIDIKANHFILPVLLTVTIALLAQVIEIYKATGRNPVLALKNE